MKPLSYHRRTKDAGLAPLFNTYFQRLRGLYEGGVRWYHKTQPLKYWSAELRINQEHLSVSLTSRDHAGFEFFTTGKPVQTGTVTQESTTLNTLKAACVHVSVELNDESVTWRSEIRGAKRSVDGMTISSMQRPFQVQLTDEPVREPAPITYIFDRPKYLKTLYETWAPGTSHSGVHTRVATQARSESVLTRQYVIGLPGLHGTIQGAKGSTGTHLLRDVMYDTPWAIGEGGRPVHYALLNSDSVLPVPTPKVDWPRASGLQTVTHPSYGKREFGVYIDSYNQVSVFPTGHLHAPNGVQQTVDQKYVKTASMGLPGWVWQPATSLKDHWLATGTTGVTDFPENDWKLRHDGTKAVAICYTKVNATLDRGFLNEALPNAFTYDQSVTGAPMRSRGTVPGDSQRHWVAPGLVEVTIDIAITGPKPEDYTLTVSSAALRDPTSTDYCTLFAGYVWYDMPDGSARQGDLCVWDVERYYRLPEDSDMPASWWTGAPITYEEKLSFVAPQDHERFWGVCYGSNLLSLIPTHNAHFEGASEADISPPGPPWGTAGLTLSALAPYGHDLRRTLYSLKNLTQSGRELRTFPGCPSGVAQGYAIPPNVEGERIILGDNIDPRLNGYNVTFEYRDSTFWPWEGPRLATQFCHSPTGADVDSSGLTLFNIISIAKVNTMLTYHGGLIMVPVHARSQFLKVDMTTLSFVMKFSVGTTDYRRTYDPHSTPLNSSMQWFTLHPAIAVWTWNTARQTFFPDSMPNEYSQPSPYYTEPAEAQVPLKTRLKALIAGDFRQDYMSAHTTWQMLALGGGPTDWQSTLGIANLRLAVGWGGAGDAAARELQRDALHYGGTAGAVSADEAMWWSTLGAYGSPLGYTVYSNPHFHWGMYSDLIQNAVMYDPMTCFFTHPNGTWAYFDQTHFYNRNGLPNPALLQYEWGMDYVTSAGSSGGWSTDKLEHWIIDHVHLGFTLPKGRKVFKETSFRELYNEAVDNLPNPCTETFTKIALPDLKATFTIMPLGTACPYGLSLKMTWNGHDFLLGEDNVVNGPGETDYSFQTNGSTIDLNLNYLFGGTVPQLVASDRITFSSCVLIEAIDE